MLAVLAERAALPAPYDTYAVRTGSGGLHLYFTAPGGPPLRNTAGRLGWLIDTRAAGGYVVAAESTVAGRRYEVVADATPATLPDWLAATLADPEPRPASARGITRPAGYAAAALRQEIAGVLDAQSGGRNHRLNAAAFALGQLVAGGLLPADVVDHALTAAGLATGLPAREVHRTIRSGVDAGAGTPRRVPA